MKVILFTVAIATTCVFAASYVDRMEIKEVNDVYKQLVTKEDLLKFITEDYKAQREGPVQLKDFSFKDCGTADAMVTIKDLTVSPDPLAFPGPINVAADFTIKSPLNAPLKGDVYIAKKVLGKYVKLPCVDNFGSCTYPDLCQLLEQVQCPDPIVRIGIDCTCPLKANSYTLPKTEFDVDASVIPAGDYSIRANATYMGKEGTCIELTLSFE